MDHAWKTRSASIATLAIGARVRVIGQAVATAAATTAPITGRSCLAYTHHLFMDSSTAASVAAPAIASSVAFAVDDGTGTIAIAEDLDVIVDIDAPVVVGEPDARPVFGASIIAREARASGFASMTNHVGCLVPGERVAVVGTVTQDPDGARRLVGTPRHPLLISTKPKAFT